MQLRVILALLCCVVAASCGGKKKSKPRDGAGNADPYGWAAATGPGAITAGAGGSAGTVSGVVGYEGEPPAPKIDRAAAGCGGATNDPSLRVANGALQGAVVFLVGATGPVTPAPVRMTQKGCLYDPPVLVGAVGSKLIIGNDDSLLHNLHGYQDDEGLFNKPSAAGSPVETTLADPGVVVMKCDVHPWMLAHILAFDHPYYALVDDAGKFSFAAPPPGDYELVVWHAKLGAKRAPVKVDAGSGLQASIAYP